SLSISTPGQWVLRLECFLFMMSQRVLYCPVCDNSLDLHIGTNSESKKALEEPQTATDDESFIYEYRGSEAAHERSGALKSAVGKLRVNRANLAMVSKHAK
uniref:Alpha-1,6-mannosyl-glycoprotein 6-beta-N-acetylglucosaminyltransferase n=1 Tax=Parascaris univalens TaxID=6257 RepID=A0A914ZUQ0_PARUN